MPRPKTITDIDVLKMARKHFLQQGAGASTRSIAKDAGVSEAILFQRFGTKEGLFFAAMVPPAAELDDLFDVMPGKKTVLANLEKISAGILDYFREVIPIFLPLVTHPAFDMAAFLKQHEIPAMQINQRLNQYLSAEAELGRVGKKHLAGAVNLLISMLHNLAIGETIGASDPKHAPQAMTASIATIWDGIRN